MTSPMTTCPACSTTLQSSIDTYCPNERCIYDGTFDGEATRLKTTMEADPHHVSTAVYILREWQDGRRPGVSLEEIAAEIVEKTAGRTYRRWERVPANLAEARDHWRNVGRVCVGDIVELHEDRLLDGPWKVTRLEHKVEEFPGLAVLCEYVGVDPEYPITKVQVPLVKVVKVIKQADMEKAAQ